MRKGFSTLVVQMIIWVIVIAVAVIVLKKYVIGPGTVVPNPGIIP
jgi:hypothetical protein